MRRDSVQNKEVSFSEDIHNKQSEIFHRFPKLALCLFFTTIK